MCKHWDGSLLEWYRRSYIYLFLNICCSGVFDVRDFAEVSGRPDRQLSGTAHWQNKKSPWCFSVPEESRELDPSGWLSCGRSECIVKYHNSLNGTESFKLISCRKDYLNGTQEFIIWAFFKYCQHFEHLFSTHPRFDARCKDVIEFRKNNKD